jgi:CubicO group peptidase (beta-lactamase class C family)
MELKLKTEDIMNSNSLANKITFLFFFLFFAFSFSTFAKGGWHPHPKKEIEHGSLTKKVDRLLAWWSQGDIPGAAVIIIQGDKVLLKKGYGLADIETKVPISPDTSFLLASVTKQFTAIAIMPLFPSVELARQ